MATSTELFQALSMFFFENRSLLQESRKLLDTYECQLQERSNGLWIYPGGGNALFQASKQGVDADLNGLISFQRREGHPEQKYV